MRPYNVYYYGSLRSLSSKLSPPIRRAGEPTAALKIFG